MEYGLIIALVAVLAIAGLVVFGPAVSSLLSKLDKQRWQDPTELAQLRSDIPRPVARVVEKLMEKRAPE